ncbi:MAG: allantoate amidohydrolase [Caulobacteraceae bacterium]|nr:allantoate amidohydrolase [Caulobacteraceae bacterium]
MGARAVARCDTLGASPYSESPDFLLRPFLTASHRAALDRLTDWMTEAGMAVRLDPIGNLIGRYEGAAPGAPALLIGSHIDTVPGGGRYDGALGVMLGVECVGWFAQRQRRLPFALEVIAFGDEEGSRFPASMLCSRALADGMVPEALAVADEAGVTVAQALTAFGLDPARTSDATRKPGEILAFLEPHIEQGPVLEADGLSLGVVTGIAAQLRLKAKFTGVAGHAGTTPMRLRSDALAAAAEGMLAVERICRAGAEDLVGTVGRVQTSTQAFNVIVGEAELSIDLRSGDRARRDAAAALVREALTAIAAARGLALDLTQVQDLPGSPCDPDLTDLLAEAIADVGVAPRRLMSGAGHDAMTVARLAPVAMLFIRCEGGVSHNAAEQVTTDDTDDAARAMIAFIERLGARCA